MATINLTNDQFRTARQAIQNRYIKIELLNNQFQILDSVEGRCIGGNLSIQADSDIRRTGNITLIVSDSSFEIEPGGKIWLDKYLRLWVGIEEVATKEISWTNCGIYIIDAPSYSYDIISNTLSLSLLDLMAKLTGIRNGYLKGVPISFPLGSSIRDAIISILKLVGFENFIVDNPPSPGAVPFDLEFGQGATAYEVLRGLIDLYPGYEMFFDVNGTFIYQRIPDGTADSVFIDDTIWSSIVLNEEISVDFQNVKNSIEVYGRTHNPARFSIDTKVVGNNIHLSIADVYHYFDDIIYGFTLKDNPGYNNMTLEINELGKIPVTMEDGKTPATIPSESGEVYYCVQYKGDHFFWLGHLQSYAMVEDTNPSSPFYVESTIGRIRLPLFGGEYDNIFTDELALQRAKYELYLHANMNDTVNLTCIPVYWMDVNLKVSLTTRRKKMKEFYIIKEVSIGLSPSDTMSLTLMKFYPKV